MRDTRQSAAGGALQHSADGAIRTQCSHPSRVLLTPQDHDLVLEYADELRGAWPVLAPPRARPRERPEELPRPCAARERCSPTAAPPPLLPSARQVEPLKGAMSRAKHAVGC